MNHAFTSKGSFECAKQNARILLHAFESTTLRVKPPRLRCGCHDTCRLPRKHSCTKVHRRTGCFLLPSCYASMRTWLCTSETCLLKMRQTLRYSCIQGMYTASQDAQFCTRASKYFLHRSMPTLVYYIRCQQGMRSCRASTREEGRRTFATPLNVHHALFLSSTVKETRRRKLREVCVYTDSPSLNPQARPRPSAHLALTRKPHWLQAR